MNDPLFTIVVSWQTRNWRKTSRAENWCKDYGLKALHKKLHIGTLYRKEQSVLDKKMKTLFSGKTDSYHSFSMCASCAKDATRGHEKVRAIVDNRPTYEILQIAE